MSKYIAVAASLAVVVFMFYGNFGLTATVGQISPELSLSFPSAPAKRLVAHPVEALVGTLAWATWQNYLSFAKAHDLAGIRDVSYQISPTCNDPSKREICNSLMDSIYLFGQTISQTEFKYIKLDAKQIIMYTDGPEVKLLYFARDAGGTLKILGARICDDTEAHPGESCADLNADTRDDNGNGWWNSTESLFY